MEMVRKVVEMTLLPEGRWEIEGRMGQKRRYVLCLCVCMEDRGQHLVSCSTILHVCLLLASLQSNPGILLSPGNYRLFP